MELFDSCCDGSPEVCMSNERNFPARGRAQASQSSSLIVRGSSAGATMTPADSTALCFTSASAETPTSSGNSTPEPSTAVGTLADRVSDERYAARVSEVAERVATAADQAELHRLLRAGVAALGAERAAFVSFEKDRSELSSCRFMLECSPQWCQRYLERGGPSIDAWIRYAARESEPVVASALNIVEPAQQAVAALAIEAGFVSALLVPAHSGANHPRVSLLCLGHSVGGYFEAEGLARVRVCARALALEVHDWWLARIRNETLARSRITEDELLLLERYWLGHTSKRIGNELNLSKTAVNSRFQRLLLKLGVANRRSAARLAVDCGLIAR
jgi:DNA-binding NarL/FixJ family response regulator